MLWAQGEPAEHIYFVKAGQVRLMREVQDPRPGAHRLRRTVPDGAPSLPLRKVP